MIFFHWLFDDIDVESASKFVPGKHRILTTLNNSGSCVIHIVIVLCLPLLSVWQLSFISKSSQNLRQDLFQKWKLYRRTRTPSWSLSISGVIRILIRVIRLANGKPCRCYSTCGYMIFMTWLTWRSCDKHIYEIYSSQNKKKKKKKKKNVREKSRECHNHKPQSFPDTKRKRTPTTRNKHKSNKRTKNTKISSLFSKRGNPNVKRAEKHKNKITQVKA